MLRISPEHHHVGTAEDDKATQLGLCELIFDDQSDADRHADLSARMRYGVNL